MLVRSATKRLEIPHEPGQHMTLRRLSWRQLEEASETASLVSLERAGRMGPEMVVALRKIADGEASEGSEYDKATVLHYGITEWSYEEKVTPENIDMLDQQTADWAFLEILKLNEADNLKND